MVTETGAGRGVMVLDWDESDEDVACCWSGCDEVDERVCVSWDDVAGEVFDGAVCGEHPTASTRIKRNIRKHPYFKGFI